MNENNNLENSLTSLSLYINYSTGLYEVYVRSDHCSLSFS